MKSEELCEMLQGVRVTHGRLVLKAHERVVMARQCVRISPLNNEESRWSHALVLKAHELRATEKQALDWRTFFAPVAALYAGAR